MITFISMTHNFLGMEPGLGAEAPHGIGNRRHPTRKPKVRRAKKEGTKMSVKQDRFREVAKNLGLVVEEQAAFLKIQMGDKAIYIAHTQKVTRVDVSGYTFQHPALTVITPERAKEMKLGRVRGQLDFTKGEDAVLEAFTTACALLRHLSGATAKDLGKFNRFVKAVSPSLQVVEPRRKGIAAAPAADVAVAPARRRRSEPAAQA